MHMFFFLGGKRYSIILFYLSGSSNVTTFIQSIEKIIKDPRQAKDTFVIIGDANIDLTIPDNENKTTRYIQSLIDLNMKQLITKPTTINNSIIDHIWVSNKNIDHFQDVRNTYYSDHMPLLLDIY